MQDTDSSLFPGSGSIAAALEEHKVQFVFNASPLFLTFRPAHETPLRAEGRFV
jgi:hypothetical protein